MALLLFGGQHLCELGGVYIFSRIALDNADMLGISLAGTYVQEGFPYTIYLYYTLGE